MIEENRIVKVISLFNKLTKHDEIIWGASKNPSRLSLSGEETLNGFVYDTTYNNQLLRLFKYNYTDYHPDYDRFIVLSATRLSFIDKSGLSLWDFPPERGIEDLYETVRFKTSNVKEFFDNLNLDEEEEDLPDF